MTVVVSSAAVLALTTATTTDNPIIGYQQLATTANISATYEDADYPVSNIVNVSTDSKWKSTTAALQYVTAAINTVDDIDYVGIAKHNFGTAGITVSVEGDPDGLGFDEIVEPFLPGDDSPLILRFDPAAYVSVRIKLTAGSAAPQCAVMYVGKLLVMSRRIYVGHTPLKLARQDKVVNGMSESGNFLGRILLRTSVAGDAAFANVSPSWYRTYFEPFVAAARQKPFFWAWRPGTYSDECGFAWLTSIPQPSNQRSNGMMQMTISMAGIT